MNDGLIFVCTLEHDIVSYVESVSTDIQDVMNFIEKYYDKQYPDYCIDKITIWKNNREVGRVTVRYEPLISNCYTFTIIEKGEYINQYIRITPKNKMDFINHVSNFINHISDFIDIIQSKQE